MADVGNVLRLDSVSWREGNAQCALEQGCFPPRVVIGIKEKIGCESVEEIGTEFGLYAIVPVVVVAKVDGSNHSFLRVDVTWPLGG